MLVFKTIKPSRLKVDAIRAELLKEMRDIRDDIYQDFRKTSRTWNHKVSFTSIVELDPKGPALFVGTDDPIWCMVNEGTPEHLIPLSPKEDGTYLQYQSAFIPKTVVGELTSHKGGKHGPYDRKRKQVLHPGFEGRGFDKIIEEKWKTPFKRRMEDAMKRGIRASGHGVNA